MNDTYFLRPPKAQRFYRLLAMWMTFVGVGNQTWWGYHPVKYPRIMSIYKFLLLTVGPLIFFSQALYLYMNYSVMTYRVKGIVFTMFPVTGYTNLVQLSSNLQSYKNVMKNFMEGIHLCNYPVQNKFVQMERIRIEKTTRFVSYFLIAFLMTDWVTWSFATAFNSYNHKNHLTNETMDFETILYLVAPLDYENDYTSWVIIHSFNVYAVWIGVSLILAHNCTNFAVILQIIGHIKVLNHTIKTLCIKSLDKNDVRKRLLDIIKHHCFILKIFQEIQSGLGFNISAFYFYNFIADSMLLYQCMSGVDKKDRSMYGFMFVAYLGGLVLMSFVLEEIRRQSDNLSKSVYALYWEMMSVADRKIFLLFLGRVQPVMVFTAFGGLKTGIMPMISIVKSTFSYYVMLKQSMRS